MDRNAQARLPNAAVERPAQPVRSNRMLDGQSSVGEAPSPEQLARPTVPISPERALWTRGARWIVDLLFVWAANDAIYEHDRFRPVSLDELANRTRDVRVGTRISMF